VATGLGREVGPHSVDGVLARPDRAPLRTAHRSSPSLASLAPGVSCHSSRPPLRPMGPPSRRPRAAPRSAAHGSPLRCAPRPADTGASAERERAGRSPPRARWCPSPRGRSRSGARPATRAATPPSRPTSPRVAAPRVHHRRAPLPQRPGAAAPHDRAHPRGGGARLRQSEADRLCSELEWERACKGPGATMYPGGQRRGAARSARQGDLGRCASSGGRSRDGNARRRVDPRRHRRPAPSSAAPRRRPPLHRCTAAPPGGRPSPTSGRARC
jgi:hypothetical protein